MSLFSQTPDFDFIGRRWYAVALSTAIILAGVVVVVIRGGLPFGIDFAGGTLLVLEFEQSTSENDVRDVLSAIEEKGVRQSGNSGQGIQIRLPQSGPEVGTSLEAGAEEVISILEGSGLGEFEVISRELVGPVIGAELSRRGLNYLGSPPTRGERAGMGSPTVRRHRSVEILFSREVLASCWNSGIGPRYRIRISHVHEYRTYKIGP